MDVGTAFATLLHVLVFVYWLGGDLGAFYAATLLTDTARPDAARAAAATVVSNIDMAPRSALILAAPTGLQLADLKGWLALEPVMLAAIWAGALIWLALAWTIHLRHAPAGGALRQIDLAVRWVVIVTLLAVAIFAPALGVDAPLFVRLKLAILAGAMACGLAIRAALSPFGPAFATMLATGATPDTDAAISRAIGYARRGVVAIWALLITAAWLGLATPDFMETI